MGLVSQVNEENEDIAPNMARGNGCCGRMVPEGSVSPGRIWIGIARPISSK